MLCDFGTRLVVPGEYQTVDVRAIGAFDHDGIRHIVEEGSEALLDKQLTEEISARPPLLQIPRAAEQVGLSSIQPIMPIVAAPDAVHCVAVGAICIDLDLVAQCTSIDSHG